MPFSDGSFSIGSRVWPGVSKLIEESGELQQVLGKLIAMHGAFNHWDGSDLAVRLVEEMGDVLAAIAFVSLALSEEERLALETRRWSKFALFCKWHKEGCS